MTATPLRQKRLTTPEIKGCSCKKFTRLGCNILWRVSSRIKYWIDTWHTLGANKWQKSSKHGGPKLSKTSTSTMSKKLSVWQLQLPQVCWIWLLVTCSLRALKSAPFQYLRTVKVTYIVTIIWGRLLLWLRLEDSSCKRQSPRGSSTWYLMKSYLQMDSMAQAMPTRMSRQLLAKEHLQRSHWRQVEQKASRSTNLHMFIAILYLTSWRPSLIRTSSGCRSKKIEKQSSSSLQISTKTSCCCIRPHSFQDQTWTIL